MGVVEPCLRAVNERVGFSFTSRPVAWARGQSVYAKLETSVLGNVS